MSSSKNTDVQRPELELKRLELEQAHEFNLKGMEAQNKYKFQEMRNRFNIFLWILAASIASFLAMVGLVVACVWNQKEQFALDFFKSVVLPIFTGVGGYLAGRQRSSLTRTKPVVVEEPAD